MNDEFLMDDLDDEKTIEFIRTYLPQELKEQGPSQSSVGDQGWWR